MTIEAARDLLTETYVGADGIVSVGVGKDCILVYVDKAASGTTDQRELLSEMREAIAPVDLKVSFSSPAVAS